MVRTNQYQNKKRILNQIKYTNSVLNRHYRFANGFGADARRKRHTADSGYGSEQPLDRRWSQDFSQDVSIGVRLNHHHSEN